MNKKLIQYLESEKCFKLVCGANNANYDEITKLVALYSSAGCKFFDIEASNEAIVALLDGIKFSKVKREDIFICISVGVNQDPHLTKYKIDKTKCTKCTKCLSVCPQSAIIQEDFIEIIEKNCIGCSKCFEKTKCAAFVKYQKIRKWEEFLKELFDKVDCIEFHIISDDIDEINKKWEYLCSNYSGMLSICCDRSCLGDKKIIEQLDKMIKRANRKVIIQADGAPMSGGCDDYKTTLQTVAFVELINKNNLDAYVIMSGGTNSKTMELARLLNINNNGAAFGSFARKIVKEYTSSGDFLIDFEKFNKAKNIAKQLFQTV